MKPNHCSHRVELATSLENWLKPSSYCKQPTRLRVILTLLAIVVGNGLLGQMDYEDQLAAAAHQADTSQAEDHHPEQQQQGY